MATKGIREFILCAAYKFKEGYDLPKYRKKAHFFRCGMNCGYFYTKI